MSNRDNPIARAAHVEQILNDPEFQRAFEEQRGRIIGEIERYAFDGDNDSGAIALVQKLQAAIGFKAEFVRVLQSADREVKRQDREDDSEKAPFDPTALPNKGER